MSASSEGNDAQRRKRKISRKATVLSEEGSSASRSSNLSTESERSAQMINQNLQDIILMSQESLAESIEPIDTVIRQHYKEEIIEESYLLRDNIHIFLINLHISLWPKIKKYPKFLYKTQMNKLQKCFLFSPIPNNFNFTSCTVSQFWAVVFMTAKCCGEVFANMWIGYFLLSGFLRKEIPSLFFIYIVMPVFAYLLNQKTPMTKLSLAERRLLVLVFSFWTGASTHYILINWDPGVYPPPPLYSPTLVALLFEFVGPVFASNRPLLLLSTIGVASCVCFTYAYIYVCFTFTYFYTSLVAIASSFYGMQQHLADPKLGRGDMSEGHVLLPIYSMYNQLVMTVLFGKYIWNRDPNAAVPNSLEERYTLLLRRLH